MIYINAPNGFLVGVPAQNSDITANAYKGSGGRVEIKTFGIFGIQQRSREDLVRSLRTEDPGNLNAQKLPSNDITAIFQQNAALSGQVNINTVNAEPTSGLVELPADIVDQSGLITQGCPAKRGDALIITGRGGLPSLPNQALRSHQTATIDWVTQRRGGEGGRGRVSK